MIEIGVPVWTTGVFRRASAVDDLGIESVGARLLRRLLPGIVEITPNARYYTFYPFLLDEWERNSDSVALDDFRPYYRRQEAAFALSCLLHDHRGQLAGVNGSLKARAALAASGAELNVDELAHEYMDSSLGGYGLYYARVLEDIRLTRAGLGRRVARVTELGRRVAEAFRSEIESTAYYRVYFDAPIVPRDVLAEYGERACLCALPGANDHEPLLDVFFAPHDDDPGWDERRKTRARSLGLFLDFHDQRPENAEGSIRTFRSCLAGRRFPDGASLGTSWVETQESWRAYQLREAEVYALTTIWSAYLDQLADRQPVSREELVGTVVAALDWSRIGLESKMLVSAATEHSDGLVPDGQAVVDHVYALADQSDDPGLQIAHAILVLLSLARRAADKTSGFGELVDEGGPGRWSLAYLAAWVDRRRDWTLDRLARDLLDSLHDLHIRVAVEKVSLTDSRDPFCLSEEDGLLTLVRPDEPFWTGARFWVVNHLLWTLDLLDGPAGDARLTSRGREIALEIATGA